MVKQSKKIIAYYRVSTRKQERSGLGLDGQREAVQNYVQSIGGVLVAEFTEIESGRVCERPSLDLAMRLARKEKASLCVAKLDRLSRNVAFIATILESGVDFAVCNLPMANKLTIHVMAAMAEYEVDMIRDRIKVALKAAKARGKQLGSHRPGHWIGHEAARSAGGKQGVKIAAETRLAQSQRDYVDVIPTAIRMRSSGASLQAIADAINNAGHQTTGGGKWQAMTVQRLLARYGSGNPPQSLIPSPLTPR
jgi:DNA invertase Pin-like site-specific DNA recombinase